MTITTMVWVQKNVHDVRNATKTVLCYLAQRAHYDDGTAAWPAMDTIASDCGITVKTVQRAIDALIEKGYVELGQQDFAGFDPKTGQPVRRDRRTVVWNVICKDSNLPKEQTEETQARTADSVRRHAKKAAARTTVKRKDDVDKMSPRSTQPSSDKISPRSPKAALDKMSPREPESDVDKMSENLDKMSPNNTRKHNPSAPTGHLPASGANHREGGVDPERGDVATGPQQRPSPSVETVTFAERPSSADAPVAAKTIPQDDDAWDEADPEDDDEGWTDDKTNPVTVPEPAPGDRLDAFLARIAVERAENGLTTKPATTRDRQAIRRLADRLEHAGMDPWPRMAEVLEHALGNDFQAKRVDSGRRFARLYDELANDLTLDRRHAMRVKLKTAASTPQPSGPDVKPVPSDERPDHRHTARCRHVRELVDSAAARAVEPSYPNRHEHDDQVAAWLAGHTPRETLDLLTATLQHERAQHDRDMARLAEIRRANGGTMARVD